MMDYREGLKKEVAEIKFLIHDLRVERFINEVIHFHVTLNTDLEIYSIEQAQILHGHDLEVLKAKAVNLRKALRDYSNAVKNFSPEHTILRAGRNYVDTIRSTCALILNPLWGRVGNVLTFLPPDSRSARSHDHYRNCIHWIGGVSQRIEHFLDEERDKGIYEEFDVGTEIEEFTRNVIHGYVAEQSGATVDLEIGRLDSARLGGNRYRFRRMYFNLVMNSVDAMVGRKPGMLEVSDTVEGEYVVLRVRDNGVGMSDAKIQQLLTDKETLDGELHSLGFVFVRQTIAQFKGQLAVESELGSGTTVTIRFPLITVDENTPSPTTTEPRDRGAKADSPVGVKERRGAPEPTPEAAEKPVLATARSVATDEKNRACGRIIEEDFHASDAQYPGCIFLISVTENGRVDYFTHRPQDRWWNMNHEDLSPMYHKATVRGRLEEDDEKRLLLTLKEPQSIWEYFEFKGVPEVERHAGQHAQMVHDEYVRIARKLIETGLSPGTRVEVAGLQRFFPETTELKNEPFALSLLAAQRLTGEEGGT